MGTSSVRYIDLPRKELEHLNGAGFLSPAQLDAIGDARWVSAATATIVLPGAAAETFREAFTEQLTKIGFDEAYQPTEEGRLLEDLITLFSAKG